MTATLVKAFAATALILSPISASAQVTRTGAPTENASALVGEDADRTIAIVVGLIFVLLAIWQSEIFEDDAPVSP